MIKKVFCIIIVVLILFSFPSCDKKNTDSNSDDDNLKNTKEKIEFSSTMLDNYMINFTDVQNLGIVKSDSSTTNQNKNYLTSLDSEGNITNVVFTKTTNGKSFNIKQENIPAWVDKMYVTKNFIYIRFTNKDTNDYTTIGGVDIDAQSYFCNKNYQSFAIDKNTGKVFSLSSLETVFIVADCYIKSGKLYYKPSVVDGNLTFEPYLTNPNIIIHEICEDKYGTVYIRNNTVTETIDNKLFIKSNYSYGRYIESDEQLYLLGDDGVMYVMSKDRSTPIKCYNSNRQLVDIPNNLTVYLPFEAEKDISFFINGNYIYALSYRSLSVRLLNDNSGYNNNQNASANYYTYCNGEIFGIRESDSMVCNYTAVSIGKTNGYLNFEFTEIETGLKAKKISSEGDFLLATVEDIIGTKKYKVYMNGNTPVYELYEEIDYGKEFIVIKPLNTK